MEACLRLRLPETVVLTGASSGFGLECARQIIAAGGAVVGVDLADPPPDLAAKEYQHVKGSVTAEAVWDEVRTRLDGAGSLGLLTCAGTLQVGTVVDHDVEGWRNVFDVNVFGGMLALRTVIPLMVARGGGSCVLIGSVDALHAEQMLVSYCASKAAVYQMARATALDFARDGVRVNLLSPGPMRVGLFERHVQALGDPELVATRERREPSGRLPQPEEVAPVALFLLSQGAGRISGTEVTVDGGLTAGYEFRVDA
jgi:2,3-dihydro-2,3-dihydroxybenzoate dehydrogenase